MSKSAVPAYKRYTNSVTKRRNEDGSWVYVDNIYNEPIKKTERNGDNFYYDDYIEENTDWVKHSQTPDKHKSENHLLKLQVKALETKLDVLQTKSDLEIDKLKKQVQELTQQLGYKQMTDFGTL